MTIQFPGESPSPEDLLGATESFYAQVVLELYRTINAVRAGEFTEIKSAQASIRELRGLALQVLEERGKVDKLRKQIAGQVGAGGALDLEGARSEIGRRLACLRGTGRGG